MKFEIFEKLCSERFPFWDMLKKEDQSYIYENTYKKIYKKNTTIYDGSEEGGLIVVNSGCLRVYIISDDDKELTLMRIHKDELCILSASFINEPITFDIFVDAEEDSDCYFISGEAFEKINNKYEQAEIYALENTVDCLSNIMWIMQQVLFMSMDKRLAIFLLDEISRTQTDTVMLTHSLIAKYMGSAREVVSRMLKYFENEGIVELSRRGVKIVDKKRLRELTI